MEMSSDVKVNTEIIVEPEALVKFNSYVILINSTCIVVNYITH